MLCSRRVLPKEQPACHVLPWSVYRVRDILRKAKKTGKLKVLRGQQVQIARSRAGLVRKAQQYQRRISMAIRRLHELLSQGPPLDAWLEISNSEVRRRRCAADQRESYSASSGLHESFHATSNTDSLPLVAMEIPLSFESHSKVRFSFNSLRVVILLLALFTFTPASAYAGDADGPADLANPAILTIAADVTSELLCFAHPSFIPAPAPTPGAPLPPSNSKAGRRLNPESGSGSPTQSKDP